MKIVDRATFLALPLETLFSKYQPCAFEDMCIKGDTICREGGAPIDFYFQALVDAVAADDSGEFFATLDQAEQTGESVRLDFDCQQRDGCFDQDQLFAVWERADVDALIDRLRTAVAAMPESG